MVCVVMLAGLLGLAAATVTTAHVNQLDHDVKSLSPAMDGDRADTARRQERLFALITTTSVKRLATTTITALSTCVSISMGAVACNGRKKRNILKNLAALTFDNDVMPELAGSQIEEQMDEEEGGPLKRGARQVTNRDGRKFTVWSTYSSTLTLTSTSYVAGTTVLVTAYCIAPGLTNGCFGK
ncbi:hypothetical protein OTU49_005731 [Cherax quadricarinatus]|uniref:Uncharacterized protein n=1 Tax=Cherax quadricarinatus TaxID=27406 RepID=A0AAW0YR74_CHEQU